MGTFNRPCPQRGDGYREDIIPTQGYLMLVDIDVQIVQEKSCYTRNIIKETLREWGLKMVIQE